MTSFGESPGHSRSLPNGVRRVSGRCAAIGRQHPMCQPRSQGHRTRIDPGNRCPYGPPHWSLLWPKCSIMWHYWHPWWRTPCGILLIFVFYLKGNEGYLTWINHGKWINIILSMYLCCCCEMTRLHFIRSSSDSWMFWRYLGQSRETNHRVSACVIFQCLALIMPRFEVGLVEMTCWCGLAGSSQPCLINSSTHVSATFAS